MRGLHLTQLNGVSDVNTAKTLRLRVGRFLNVVRFPPSMGKCEHLVSAGFVVTEY